MPRIALAVLLVTIVPALQAVPEGVPQLPAGAFNVEDYTVPGSKTMQTAFRLKSEYPHSTIIDHYTDSVSSQWQACKARNHGWQTYIKKSGKHPQRVHQHIRYWVSFEQSKMMSVIVRHYSDSDNDEPQCTPDDDVQHGVLVVSHSPELDKEILLLQLRCDFSATNINRIPKPLSCAK